MRADKFNLFLEKHPSVANTHFSAEQLQFITDLMPPTFYPRMLDVGCADGCETKVLKELGYKVTGITQGSVNVEYAHAHFAGVDVREMDMHDLDFRAETFDCIFMQHVYEHALSPFILLFELYAVLKPNGRVWIDMPPFIVDSSDAAYQPIITEPSYHHTNLYPFAVNVQYFTIFFIPLGVSEGRDPTHCFLLQKRPLSDLHSNIQMLLKEREDRF